MAEGSAANGGAALVVDDLHKSFGSLEVLKGVSLTARDGDVISLIGSSGSGKSTFLRCINLLEIPNAGRIEVKGELIRMKPLSGGLAVPADKRQVDRIRARLGMVFQSFNLWSHMTVLENVIEAPVHVKRVPKAEAVEKAAAILDKVGMSDRQHYYPAHLSGGQQQRAAIARALAMEPDVLLFDEPTSALDPELVGEVLKTSNLAGFTTDAEKVSLDDVDTAEQAAIDKIKATFTGKTIGVQVATTHENFLNEVLADDVDIRTYDTQENLDLDLAAGRVDAALAAMSYWKPLLDSDKGKGFAAVGPTMNGGPFGAGVGAGIRQKDTDLVAMFSKAIGEARADGTVDRLALQWFGFTE